MKEKRLATRPATGKDFEYVWTVYKEAVKPYIGPKLSSGWVDAVEVERFRKAWKPANSHIITVDDTPIGWGGAVVLDNEVRIEHLYIEPAHQRKGYGSRLASELLKMWSQQGKSIYAPVLREGPGAAIASRVGFEKYADEQGSLTQMLTYRKK